MIRWTKACFPLLVGLVIVSMVGCSKEVAPTEQAGAAAEAPKARPTQVAKKPPARSAALVLPESTSLTVRTTSAISTQTHQAGDAFTATLEEPVAVGQRLVAARGATVEGRVIEADKGGRVKGLARLEIQLTQLHTADGRVVEITTNTVAREAKATKGDDAKKIGIGSGVGAAIGAIAGGGKGAAVGAAAGAGAGTGLVLATRGAAAVVPSETVLNFQLVTPVTVSGKS